MQRVDRPLARRPIDLPDAKDWSSGAKRRSDSSGGPETIGAGGTSSRAATIVAAQIAAHR